MFSLTFMHAWVTVVPRSIQCLSYGPDIATRAKLIPVCSEIEVQAAAEKVKDSDLKVRINSTVPWVEKMLTGTP